jgi:hypothetical protein
MVYTDHTFLVGEGAEDFATMIGDLKPAPVTTNDTLAASKDWIQSSCQPNYYTNLDGADTSCGPYAPSESTSLVAANTKTWASQENHDTIGIIALSHDGKMACGTSTNGANHKVREPWLIAARSLRLSRVVGCRKSWRFSDRWIWMLCHRYAWWCCSYRRWGCDDAISTFLQSSPIHECR